MLVDGRAVGYVTSAAFGYTVGRSIAYGWLPAELAAPGRTVEIESFGERLPATVAAEPLFDPEMSRLRSLRRVSGARPRCARTGTRRSPNVSHS